MWSFRLKKKTEAIDKIKQVLQEVQTLTGRKAAYLATVGFACLLFNFLVVNIFFVGFHSYAGVS